MNSSLIFRRIFASPASYIKTILVPTDVASRNNFNMSLTSRHSSSLQPSRQSCVAVCQLTSINDKEKNFEQASSLIRKAANLGAKMIFLPECADFIGTTKKESIEAAEPLDGPTVSKYKQLASDLKVWLSLGGLHQSPPADDQSKKVLNAHVILDDSGDIRSVYHKVHLFNLEIPGVVRLIESESYQAGKRLPDPVDTPIGKVGLGICYDLRFGEMAQSYAKAGADLLTYPSSFTVPTGIHHWEPLIRARAIENQCYVIAAGQVGVHNPKRSSYGHSMIVDPWGTKIAECSDGVGFALAMIDLDFLSKCRSRLPIWTDRRYDLYADIEPAISHYPIDEGGYKFDEFDIPASQVICRSRYSYAFVNHRPVLRGHMMISPFRLVKKYTDLSDAELSDIMLLSKKLVKMLELVHETDATSILCQDGKDAGQSVSHVHVHLIPRKPTDFGGNIDQIYVDLERQAKSKNLDKTHPKLSQEEMASIAITYRNKLSSM